jgi:multiple sugar transport system substrate-binding protein
VFCSNVAAHAAEFERISGHRVTVQLLGNDDYYTNKLASYLGGDQPADVYMSGPVLAWEQLGLGFVRPLDEFTGRASPSYDFADFFDRLIRGSRWTGHFGDAVGDGPLLAIPVNWESYNLAYLPDVLSRAGMDVPGTWQDYFAAAKATPAVNYIDVARRWTRALRDAHRGDGSLEQCLAAAASDIDRLVIRA